MSTHPIKDLVFDSLEPTEDGIVLTDVKAELLRAEFHRVGHSADADEAGWAVVQLIGLFFKAGEPTIARKLMHLVAEVVEAVNSQENPGHFEKFADVIKTQGDTVFSDDVPEGSQKVRDVSDIPKIYRA